MLCIVTSSKIVNSKSDLENQFQNLSCSFGCFYCTASGLPVIIVTVKLAVSQAYPVHSVNEFVV